MQTDEKHFQRFRLIRRKVALTTQNEARTSAKIKVKRLYFQKIQDISCRNMDIYYQNCKQAICLESVSLNHEAKGKWISLLKKARNMKNFVFESHQEPSSMFLWLKRLPKKIKTVYISTKSSLFEKRDIQCLYRNLAKLKSLQVFERGIDRFYNSYEPWEENYQLFNRYMARRRILVEIIHNFCEPWQTVLQKVMHKKQYSPNIVNLALEMTSNINVFDFQLFPHLRKLKLTLHRDFDYQLGQFILEGFKNLHQLEQIDLSVTTRPTGHDFLLKGLLHLPLLTSVKLELPFLQGNESVLLTQFLCKQTQLVLLSLFIQELPTPKKAYHKHKDYIEGIWVCLANKPNLEYLVLKSYYWTLESLSRGLMKAKIIDKLQDLEILVFDDHLTSSLTPSERVEGLNQFLQKHKHSLRNLKFEVRYACESGTVNSLFKAISQLDELKTLKMKINSQNYATQEYLDYFEQLEKYPEGVFRNQLHFSHIFDPLNQTLKKLIKLRTLALEIHPTGDTATDSISTINSSIVFNALVLLKDLRKLTLGLPFLEKSFQAHPMRSSILMELENVLEIVVTDSITVTDITEVNQLRRNLERKQWLRTDLMFYCIQD